MAKPFPHVATLMHSCTLHSPRNISVLFNQPCLQGSAVLEHQSDMHIQQRMCPAVQSCWLQKRARKPELQRCSGHNALIPASFPHLLSVLLEMPFCIYVTDTPEAPRACSSALKQDCPKCKHGSHPAVTPACHGGQALGVLTKELQEKEQVLHFAAGCQPSPPRPLPGWTLDPPRGHVMGSVQRRL